MVKMLKELFIMDFSGFLFIKYINQYNLLQDGEMNKYF